MFLHKIGVKAMTVAFLAFICLIIISASKVYGDDVCKATTHISQFGEYDVNTEVTVSDNKIKSVRVKGSEFGGKFAKENRSYLDRAAKWMVNKFIGLSATDISEIKKVDGCSGATYSSDAIRTGVMNALNLKEDTLGDVLPEKIASGDYRIQIKNMTERVGLKEKGRKVEHTLLGTNTSPAVLHVNRDKTMTLSYMMKSGTKDAPLYVLKYNGYYEGGSEDVLNNLSMEKVQVQNLRWTADNELKGISDTVVGKVTRPLNGIKKYYFENSRVYVPVMKGLTSPGFDKGQFNVVSRLTPDWKTLKKINRISLKNGKYTVPGKLYQPDNISQSMADGALNRKIGLEVKNGKYYLTLGFKKMKKGEIEGYLGGIKYFDTGYSISGGHIDGTLSDADILNFHTDKKGNNIGDDYGSDYPKTVKFKMIPEALENGIVPMQLSIPVMEQFGAGAGTKNVLLKLDWKTVKTIKPIQKMQSVKGFKVKAKKHRRAVASWKAVSKSSGYTLYMSFSKSGKFKAIKNINKGKTKKCVLKKLKRKKKIFFMIKAYRKVHGKKLYIAKSKVVYIKTSRR